jgi:hypothetical protein
MTHTPPELPVTLDEVISFVGRLRPDGDPLLQLQDAVVIGERLEELGDDVVGHYVHRAREDGATWAAIGESMGVTKQAAQKRFVVAVDDRNDGLLTRFTPRARRVLSVARDEAKQRGANEAGSAHLVLGLAHEPQSLALQVLQEMGVTPERLRQAVDEVAPAAGAPVKSSHLAFAGESRTVLQVAVEEALALGHNYVGTEHLLLAVLAGGDTAGARALTGLGVTRRKCLTRLKRAFERIVAERTRS